MLNVWLPKALKSRRKQPQGFSDSANRDLEKAPVNESTPSLLDEGRSSAGTTPSLGSLKTYRKQMSTMSENLPPKRIIYVHVTFLKLGEINTQRECFDADVLLRSKWREPLLDSKHDRDPSSINLEQYWTPKLFIDNKLGDPKITSSTHVEYTPGNEAYMVEMRRVKGSFMEQLELFEFPFDVQDLSVIIMSDLPTTEVEIYEDPDEIHRIFKQSFIDEQEWYLYKYIQSERSEMAKDRADPTVRRSALTVRARAARRPAYFVWNMFSVTFLICCLSFVTFSVSTELPQNRLQLTFTLVLTAVAFKFVANQSLPRISYLTYLDRYVMATMVMLVIICFYHGIQTVIPTEDHPEKDHIALAIFIGIYVIYNIQFLFRLLMVPYKRRRDMAHKEMAYVRQVSEESEQKSMKKKNQKKKYQKADTTMA